MPFPGWTTNPDGLLITIKQSIILENVTLTLLLIAKKNYIKVM